eukprot:TRINITY_DN66061_c0_g1_i1.p1 TRINITY_DN66061_c0_g1~~TRINITY_DN66061_c0_g1_i1.p1  ORF type:complete len:729 (+),score=112.08 TRINITY_DN66061_c0_g1_i1:86-2272(+)
MLFETMPLRAADAAESSEEDEADSDTELEELQCAEEKSSADGSSDNEAAPFFFTSSQPKFIRQKFKVYKWPILLSVLAELAFCSSIAGWAAANRERLGEEYSSQHCALAVQQAWATFVICLLARLLSVWCWRCRFLGFHDNTFASVYLLFSIGQWLFYMMSYYAVVDEVTTLQWKPVVQVQNNNTDLNDFLAEFDPTANMRDCLHRHPAEMCALLVKYNSHCKKARDPVHCATDMRSCLQEHSPTVCTELVNQRLRCKTPFDPLTCSGSIHLVSSEGKTVNCCVRNVYSLHVPVPEVPLVRWPMTDVLEVLKWASVLAIQWALKDMPMLPAAASSTLSDGCWLDILDAVVFSKYLTAPIVTYPRYGIEPLGTANEGYAGTQDRTLYDALLRTWILGLGATLLSPVIYTLLKPRGGDDDDVQEGDSRSLEDAMREMAECVAVLDEERALKIAQEAIRLQRESYVSQARIQDDEWQKVTVRTKGLLSRVRQRGRSGQARMTSPGLYEVRYTDGKAPAEAFNVPVKCLQLHVEGPERVYCSGWCKISNLYRKGKSKSLEQYEARAQVLDAMRSLFLLEGPFLMWRWWLDVSQLTKSLRLFGPGMFLMLKNLVWGAHDLLTILSCGNDSVTFFGFQPLLVLRNLTTGTVLGRVPVMPVGVFNVASAVVTKRAAHSIQSKRNALQIQKAWLIVEQEKAISNGTTASASEFTLALEKTNAKLQALDIQERLNHV